MERIRNALWFILLSVGMEQARAARLTVRIVDEDGAPCPARVYLAGERGEVQFAPGAINYDKARGRTQHPVSFR